MGYDLTLIETEVLEELIEDAFVLRQLVNKINWDKLKKDKEKFLSTYINVPLNLTDEIEESLKERGYKKC